MSAQKSINHYENFPVASYLMPAHLRPAVRVIYAFARSADDIADEGDARPEERMRDLDKYTDHLRCIEQGLPVKDQLIQDLAKVIQEHQLPLSAFLNLLSAFKQDTSIDRYASYSALLDYCERSANPVGHIMLHLYQCASPENLRYADCICTALQLINFWQDIAIDWKKNRIYLPTEDLHQFAVSERHIADNKCDEAWTKLLQFQIVRTRALLLAGSPLCKRISGRLGFELRLVIQGGLRILEKIETVKGDVFHQRPQITRLDAPLLLWRAIVM